MTTFMLSQIIAAISFCSDLIAFYLPKRVYVLRTLALSTFLLSVHFLLLASTALRP
ncbi:YgjV family protein [Enterobacter hormaechei]|nr:YgjV family protein [Leclercia adecarboxylata]MCE9981293.1 YgjV family protein [Leclercia adecarboxylata]